MYMYVFIFIYTLQHPIFEGDSWHFSECWHFPAPWQSIMDFRRTT